MQEFRFKWGLCKEKVCFVLLSSVAVQTFLLAWTEAALNHGAFVIKVPTSERGRMLKTSPLEGSDLSDVSPGDLSLCHHT